MTAEEIRALYVETLARAHDCAEIDESQHDATLKRSQLAAIEADVDALAAAGLLPVAEGSDVALELTRTAERLMRLVDDVKRGNAEHVRKVDRLHNEIEAAHHRWWHPLFGLRWEMTGMSTRRSRSRWNL